jgi:hypothetical protein
MTVKDFTCYRKDDLPRDFSFPNYTAETVPVILGPKQRTNVTGFSVLGEILAQIEAGVMKIYIYGEASYTDIIHGPDDPHVTKFCYLVNRFIGTPNNPNAKIGSSLCWTHNCADAECGRQQQEKASPKDSRSQTPPECTLSVVLEKK